MRGAFTKFSLTPTFLLVVSWLLKLKRLFNLNFIRMLLFVFVFIRFAAAIVDNSSLEPLVSDADVIMDFRLFLYASSKTLIWSIGGGDEGRAASCLVLADGGVVTLAAGGGVVVGVVFWKLLDLTVDVFSDVWVPASFMVNIGFSLRIKPRDLLRIFK